MQRWVGPYSAVYHLWTNRRTSGDRDTSSGTPHPKGDQAQETKGCYREPESPGALFAPIHSLSDCEIAGVHGMQGDGSEHDPELFDPDLLCLPSLDVESFYQHSVAVKSNKNRRSYGVAGLRLVLCANYLKMSQNVNLVASRGVKLASEFLSLAPDVYKNQSTRHG